MIGLQEPVAAVVVAFQRNPVHGAFGELNFPGGVAVEGEPRNHGVLEARADGGFGFVEITAGDVFLVRSGSDQDAVDQHGGP